MRIQFKKQSYQTAAMEAVADVFAGQPCRSPSPGMNQAICLHAQMEATLDGDRFFAGHGNGAVALSEEELLENLRAVQRRDPGLSESASLAASSGGKINLDIEMETGTGKPYCYIRTIFELNRRYGWTKFIRALAEVSVARLETNSRRLRREAFFYEKAA